MSRPHIVVQQCDLEWKLIQEFPSIKDAANHFDVNDQRIYQAIKNKGKCLGFRWKRKYDVIVSINVRLQAQDYTELITNIERLLETAKENQFALSDKTTIRGKITDIEDKFTIKYFKA